MWKIKKKNLRFNNKVYTFLMKQYWLILI